MSNPPPKFTFYLSSTTNNNAITIPTASLASLSPKLATLTRTTTHTTLPPSIQKPTLNLLIEYAQKGYYTPFYFSRTAELNPRILPKSKFFEAMYKHARVYVLADMYGAEGLKYFASAKVRFVMEAYVRWFVDESREASFAKWVYDRTVRDGDRDDMLMEVVYWLRERRDRESFAEGEAREREGEGKGDGKEREEDGL